MDKEQVKADLDLYFKAMRSMDGHTTCFAIERRYGLDGYPPQIVSIALNAGAKGESMSAAIDAYIDGEEEDEEPTP